MTASEESPTDQQIVYLTGDNAAGKSTLGQYIVDTHSDWHCVDGDRLVENDPALNELIVSVSKPTIDLLRGPFGDENLIETVKSHDAGVRTTWEPFFRVLFERLKQMKERKIVFVYHVWRQWVVDLFREYFPMSMFVELQVTRSLLLDRYVERMKEKGCDFEAVWRDAKMPNPLAMLREKYGPEYKGNEEHFKKYVEWRYIFYREPWWEEAQNNAYVINNDTFGGARDLEKILKLTP